MKKIICAVALLVTLLPFSSHAGMFGKEEWEKEDCPKNHSLAWCLADYQGRSKGMLDITQEQFIAKLKEAGVTDEHQIANILETSLGVGAGIGGFAMGNLFGGGVFLLHALMPDAVEQNRSNSYMVFFDKDNINRSQKEINDNFRLLTQAATKNSLSVLPEKAKITDIEEGVLKIETQASDCKGGLGCIVKYGSKKYAFSVENKKVPFYLGGNEVVSSNTGSTIGIVWYNMPNGINYGSFAKAISEKLPSWVYWYIPAGYLGGNPLPMMLNQGKALFFVKPKEGDPIPIMPHVAARFKADEKPSVQSEQSETSSK